MISAQRQARREAAALRKARIAAEVQRILGTAPFCDRCGAGYFTFDDLCDEPLDVSCPGLLRIEAALVQAAISVDGKPCGIA